MHYNQYFSALCSESLFISPPDIKLINVQSLVKLVVQCNITLTLKLRAACPKSG